MLLALRCSRRLQATPIVCQETPIQGPSVKKWCKHAAWVDDRQIWTIWITDGGPIAMGEIDMRDGKRPGNERFVPGVELTLDPVGPDPIEIVLNDPAVDEPTGVKDDTCAKQLDWHAHFGGLGEAVNASKQRYGVQKSVAARNAANDESPR
jgi:hypothetical protein